jgi:hypothetical protein
VTAVVLGVTALALALIGMVVNARQAASLGVTLDASGLLAAEGFCADLLVLMLPTVAARLWGNQQWVDAATAWAIWLGVIGFTLLATATWSATNVGDAVAGRVAITERTEGCRDIDRRDMGPCRRTIELREARARAERRDQVDREIADLEIRIAAAPSIGDGDPGAAMVAETLPRLTRGTVRPTEREVQRLQVLGLTLLPACAGLLLGPAVQARKRRRAN